MIESVMFESMVKEIDAHLEALISNCQNQRLKEAMSYSLFSGGKRVRPTILLGACEAVLGHYNQDALDFACAIEMIHTYSLIHDDLPAMDDDDFRRGVPTSHKKFGEGLAILAGDALLSRAFETMALTCSRDQNNKCLDAMLAISSAASDNGMIAGQVDDLFYQNKKLDRDTQFNIHIKKTGALFAAAFEAGALIGGADRSYVQKMKQIGLNFGLAFQLYDDMQDEGSADLSADLEHYRQISADVLNCLNELYLKTPSLLSVVALILGR